jgi:phosphatidylglycerophosphatase A
MTIKESSDELNASVVVGRGAVAERKVRTPKDYLALAIATCGVGYLPLAPGTFGSIVGIGLFAVLRAAFLKLFWPTEPNATLDLQRLGFALITFELLAVICVALVGIWAGSRTEKVSGKKDPGKVVIDEVAGQMLALVAVPLDWRSWWTIIAAFLLFRLFDIIKPYPARRLESLESGLGIMADDIVAGAYAAVAVAVLVVIQWSI